MPKPDHVRNVSQHEVAICLWCKETLHYGSSGTKRIKSRAMQNKEKHQKNKEIFLKNTTIQEFRFVLVCFFLVVGKG